MTRKGFPPSETQAKPLTLGIEDAQNKDARTQP